MSGLNELSGEAIRDICTENSGAIAESLNGCFGTTHAVSCGEPGAWNPEALQAPFDGPGLVAALEVDGLAMLALIPVTLPLPDWWRSPGKSETSRLQTLPMEWAFNVLPGDIETDATTTYAVENIAQAVAATAPSESATVLPLILAENADSLDAARVLLIWPVADPAKLKEHEIQAEPEPEPPAAPPVTATTAPDPPRAAASARIRPEDLAKDTRLRRILNVPVSVTVRIAEKRVNLQSVLMLTPGSLLTFNKSCEDLLDLYVNNCHYGRGEAVKIGEKFGLKVTEVGVTAEHHSPVIEE